MGSSFRAEMLEYEVRAAGRGCRRAAGVDEAGRGPLAGPVVAAAVVIPPGLVEALRAGELSPENAYLASVNDSKKVAPRKREKLFEALMADPRIEKGIGIADERTIDEINIFQATVEAMKGALERLGEPPPDHVLLDGNPIAGFPFAHEGIVGGDGKSLSVAAASILAKVTRDRIMLEYDRQYPQYRFAAHKGYGTAEHLALLRQFGPSPAHRRSFAPIRAV